MNDRSRLNAKTHIRPITFYLSTEGPDLIEAFLCHSSHYTFSFNLNPYYLIDTFLRREIPNAARTRPIRTRVAHITNAATPSN